jgi:predicted site-specific integrase-resolvase
MSETSYSHSKLLKENEAAKYLSVEVATLRRWRWAGKGPRFLKIEGAVRYDPSDLTEFITASRRRSTSDTEVA